MRFGESFPQGADPKNRMDVLKIKEAGEDTPAYIKFGLEIRNNLKVEVAKNGWPDLPDQEGINKTEDIFEAAKNEVNKTWEESVRVLIESKADEWKQSIKKDDPETKAALGLLNNPAELSQSFSLRQFGVLDTLRTVNPEAWRTLVVASSERQLASIAIMEHWLKNGDPKNLQAICGKMDLSPTELKLFVDMAGILGKYVDHAYVKQIELADLPGGSTENKLSQEDGAEYLYDLYKDHNSEDVNIKTYTDIFPYEWEKIQSRLERLAVRTELASEAGKLPVSYGGLADYLAKAAQVYGSKSIKPEVLDKEWKDLSKIAKEVDNDGCPLMLIPQGCSAVSGEAGKVDAEIRLGLKTKETKEQESNFNNFTATAQEIINRHQDSLAKEYKIPSVSLSYQPWAFGPNLYWLTRGESDESQILSHTNAVTETALAKEIPLLKKIFKTAKIDDQEYAKASVTETVLHEIGHNVFVASDQKISKRIGASVEANILDELKAETVGLKVLSETAQKGNLPPGLDLKTQLLAKLGTNFDYLKNKSAQKSSAGEPYYICGATIIGGLLAKGLIRKKDSGYEISDPAASIQEIVNIGDKVLAFYTNSATKPTDVKNYIKELRNKSQDPLLQEFIKNL